MDHPDLLPDKSGQLHGASRSLLRAQSQVAPRKETMMSVQSPSAEPVKPSGPGWPYVVLTVLLTAIGNNWAPSDVRALGYVLLAVVAVAYAVTRD